MSEYKPKVGETVFVLPVGNAVRRGVESTLIETKVQRVGRKYFTVEHGSYRRLRDGVKFHIADLTEATNGYCERYKFYATSTDYEIEKEYESLVEYFRNSFSWKNQQTFTIDQLRCMRAIAAKEQNE